MTIFAQLSETQAQKAATVNENFVAVSPAGLFGRKASTTTGLTWGYYGGMLFVDGTATSISDGTVALTNSTTNYIEATRAGVVSKNTSGFTAGQIPLYTAVTSGGAVSSYTDYREMLSRKALPKLSVAVTSADVTLSAAQAACELMITTGVLTGNRAVIVPAVPWVWIVDCENSGAFTTTVKTASGSGVVVVQGKRAILYCDGTDVYSAFTDPAALGLGTMASQNANSVAITGGTITGTTFNNGVIGGVTPAAITGTTGHFTGNLTVDGDLLVSGSTVQVDVATLQVEDPLIELGSGNSADTVDLGWYGNYNPSGTQLFCGLFRDASDGKFKLYVGSQSEPTTTVNVGATGHTTATLVCNLQDGGSSTLTNPANTTQTLTDASSIDWDMASGAMAKVTLGAAGRTMNAPTNIKTGGLYVLEVIQDGSGNRTITTWNSVFRFGAGTIPTQSTAAAAIDVLTFVCIDGTHLDNVGGSFGLA